MPVDGDSRASRRCNPFQNVAGDPRLVAGAGCALGEHLELPLACGDLAVDALDIDAGLKAGVESAPRCMLRPKALARAHRAVVRHLAAPDSRQTGKPGGRLVLGVPQEVLLLEAEPEIVVVVLDGGAAVRLVRRAVGVQHLGHHQVAVLAVRVGEHRHGLQQAVRGAAVRLLRGTTVERPDRALVERAPEVALHPRLAAQTLGRREAVQPDVFQLALHLCQCLLVRENAGKCEKCQ